MELKSVRWNAKKEGKERRCHNKLELKYARHAPDPGNQHLTWSGELWRYTKSPPDGDHPQLDCGTNDGLYSEYITIYTTTQQNTTRKYRHKLHTETNSDTNGGDGTEGSGR